MNAGTARELLGWLRFYLNLEWSEVDEIFDLEEGSTRDWYEEAQYPPEAREKLNQLKILRSAVREVFENNSDKAREWFDSEEIEMLDGRAPYSILKSGDIQKVIGPLAGYISGAFI